MTYADLSEKQQAFAWIDKLIQFHSTMTFLLYDGEDDKPLHKDPRFAEVKRKMKIFN
jgi:hypothetical protein